MATTSKAPAAGAGKSTSAKSKTASQTTKAAPAAKAKPAASTKTAGQKPAKPATRKVARSGSLAPASDVRTDINPKGSWPFPTGARP